MYLVEVEDLLGSEVDDSVVEFQQVAGNFREKEAVEIVAADGIRDALLKARKPMQGKGKGKG